MFLNHAKREMANYSTFNGTVVVFLHKSLYNKFLDCYMLNYLRKFISLNLIWVTSAHR